MGGPGGPFRTPTRTWCRLLDGQVPYGNFPDEDGLKAALQSFLDGFDTGKVD